MFKNSLLKIIIAKGIFAFAILSFGLKSSLSADVFNPILCNDNALDSRVITKLTDIANEVKSKTKFNVYVCIKGTYFDTVNEKRDIKEKITKIKDFETKLITKANKPYAILTISYIEKHVNILMTDELKKVIDKDDILDDYVIPLLSSYDKNDKRAKISAATLNGYSQIVSNIATAQNIKIKSNIGSEGKIAADIWRNFIYFMVIGGLILFGYTNYKERRMGK